MPAVPLIPDRLFISAAVGDTSLEELANWLDEAKHFWANMVRTLCTAEIFEQQIGTVWADELTGGIAQKKAFDKVMEAGYMVWNGQRYNGVGLLRRETQGDGSVKVIQTVRRVDLYNALCEGAVALEPKTLISRQDRHGRAFLFFFKDNKLKPAGKYVMTAVPQAREPSLPPEEMARRAEQSRMMEAQTAERKQRMAYRDQILAKLDAVEDVGELERLAAQLEVAK